MQEHFSVFNWTHSAPCISQQQTESFIVSTAQNVIYWCVYAEQTLSWIVFLLVNLYQFSTMSGN